MTAQIERNLQSEIMLRLRSWPVIALPVPNSLYFPARTDAERNIIARVVSQMKASGQFVPGAPDLCVFGHGWAGMIELKRPASRDLTGRQTQAGRPSKVQLCMAERAAQIGANHAFCTSWDDVRARLAEWGRNER